MSNSSVETKVHSFAVDQAYMHCQFNEIEQILRQHRLEDPDLYALLDKRKVIDEVIQVNEKNQLQAIVETAALTVGNLDALPEPLYHKRLAQKILKEKIATHQEAINAISEFTKRLKHWIKAHGVSAILKLIKDTLFNPWLPTEWYEAETKKPTRLTLQIE